MARYRVLRERELDMTRTTQYEAEIEISDDASESEVIAAAKRLRDNNWREADEWDESDHFTDSYEVIERLDVETETVRGKPQDFGLAQEALFG